MPLPEMLRHRLAGWLKSVLTLAADDRMFESVYTKTKGSEPLFQIIRFEASPGKSLRRVGGDSVSHI
jgi:hypothetical protein